MLKNSQLEITFLQTFFFLYKKRGHVTNKILDFPYNNPVLILIVRHRYKCLLVCLINYYLQVCVFIKKIVKKGWE